MLPCLPSKQSSYVLNIFLLLLLSLSFCFFISKPISGYTPQKTKILYSKISCRIAYYYIFNISGWSCICCKYTNCLFETFKPYKNSIMVKHKIQKFIFRCENLLSSTHQLKLYISSIFRMYITMTNLLGIQLLILK